MTILHISDTHGRHHELAELPMADVLVHSGDFTMGGSDMEALDFLEWLCDLPHRHKIFIAGNHDDCMLDASLEGLPDNVHYLHDSGVTIDGISFYGVPMLADFVDGEMHLLEHYDRIPDHVDVLITHRPPLGILDGSDTLHYGSAALLERVMTVRPRYHLFGHTHGAYGTTADNGTVFCNASLCNNNYQIGFSPILWELSQTSSRTCESSEDASR